MSIGQVEMQVREFIVNSFLEDTRPEEFKNSDDLFQLLDSLQVLRLVVELESLYGFKVADVELTADNLSSVEKVAAFVVRKGAEAEQSTAS